MVLLCFVILWWNLPAKLLFKVSFHCQWGFCAGIVILKYIHKISKYSFTTIQSKSEWTAYISSLIARLMGTTWGPSGADRTQVGPMLAPSNCYLGLVGKYSIYRHCVRRFLSRKIQPLLVISVSHVEWKLFVAWSLCHHDGSRCPVTK